ncbi:TPA: AAA family ATPase [Klebsiella aerogenes]|nr:AAA family ATPase [Klebsiella aerogenes]
MKFIKADMLSPIGEKCVVYLMSDGWDDWYHWKTQYTMMYSDHNGNYQMIGKVKIGQSRMKTRLACLDDNEKAICGKPLIENVFNRLGDDFFSLGQSENYYETLSLLPDKIKKDILIGMRDVAYNLRIYYKYSHHPAMTESLLREISERHLYSSLYKLARGIDSSSGFMFSYLFPSLDHEEREVRLSFNVNPDSMPPSNIHAIIGRNGVGKTTLFSGFIKGVINNKELNDKYVGLLQALDGDGKWESMPDYFTSLTLLSYSPFDKFGPVSHEDTPSGLKYEYIGLMERVNDKLLPKSFDTLHKDFCDSMRECRIGARSQRWKDCLKILENDPLFMEKGISNLADLIIDDTAPDWCDKVRNFLDKFSSGHLVTLISITKLVEVTEDRSLTLIDEPEAHLHPPLISAYIRAISHLMSERNGVAIVATHSPVVLQEVRSDCAWILNRTGKYVSANRPQIETFGENVGTLTREVFSHEVVNTGFYKMIADASEDYTDFDALNTHFDEKLGGEARALARSLIRIKKSES